MRTGVPKETLAGEQRVALIPASVAALGKAGVEVIVERGAGLAAGYPDAEYEKKGAVLVDDRAAVFQQAQVITLVRTAGADPEQAARDIALLRRGQTLIGTAEPLWASEGLRPFADAGIALFALELIPRITRAQSMDVLSSMATIAGYKSVLLAADALAKMVPMMMTAAGTLKPARVLVIGAGVAGLQAIATARRLGALVRGYDVRAAVREQVESLGARFVSLELDTSAAEGAGGYAKEQSQEQIRRQQELMADVIADSDVVISTAAVPGRKSPVIITAPMVERMAPGSVIVDLAADRGGNCELTTPDQRVVHGGVTILGPRNLAAAVPFHASQMFSNNIASLLKYLVDDGEVRLDTNDDIVAGTLVCRDGEILHTLVREALNLPTAHEDAAEPEGSDR